MNVIVSLKGTVMLSRGLQRLFGDNFEVNESLKVGMNIAKDLWNQYKRSK